MNAPPPRRRLLFIPGPTEVADEVLQAMTGPAIGHRGPEIQELIGEVEGGLQWLLQTKQPVILSTSSATALMEAAIVNTVGSGPILHLTCGAFSEKWEQIARSVGRDTEVLAVPWGEAIPPQRVREALGRRHFEAVALTHNETSTGVMNPLREIAAVVREHSDALLFVDAVSSMAAVDLPFDALGVDVLLAGVQKAFALPPGLAVAAVSARALERAASRPHRGTYLDFLEQVLYLEKRQTPSTPSVPHLYALQTQLRRMREEGLEARYARHQHMAIRCQQWAERRFACLALPADRSPTVTCVRVPSGFDLAALHAHLRDQDIVLGSGYGKLKASTFRIGHMGEHTEAGVVDLLQRIDRFLSGRSA